MSNVQVRTGLLIRAAFSTETSVMQQIELDAAKSYASLPGYAFSVVLPARSDDEHAFAREYGAFCRRD